MKMIQIKVDRVYYDLESDLNKLDRLSSTRGRVKILQEKPCGINKPWGIC